MAVHDVDHRNRKRQQQHQVDCDASHRLSPCSAPGCLPSCLPLFGSKKKKAAKPAEPNRPVPITMANTNPPPRPYPYPGGLQTQTWPDPDPSYYGHPRNNTQHYQYRPHRPHHPHHLRHHAHHPHHHHHHHQQQQHPQRAHHNHNPQTHGQVLRTPPRIKKTTVGNPFEVELRAQGISTRDFAVEAAERERIKKFRAEWDGRDGDALWHGQGQGQGQGLGQGRRRGYGHGMRGGRGGMKRWGMVMQRVEEEDEEEEEKEEK
ncbi:hypothetical protein C8A00DRAFT_32652 [Chaetomidium leptoderma]|uniref:Uncharacterized protein n=1 Tax=Chaetomidium leptoderma TaxID=669021 RepID=A0AAN6VPJ3_9PEZI|nr:hypothetical protein C8A00DRAFT_32652 [Chaetomidium leptoderma]